VAEYINLGAVRFPLESSPMATTTPATILLVHRILGIGLVGTATAFLVLIYLGIGPMPVHDSLSLVIAYSLSAISVVLAVVAHFVFKPRVPGRSSGQSVEQFWSRQEIGAKVLPV
jgi:hypothetical protein